MHDVVLHDTFIDNATKSAAVTHEIRWHRAELPPALGPSLGTMIVWMLAPAVTRAGTWSH
jgi:hypothetical protein